MYNNFKIHEMCYCAFDVFGLGCTLFGTAAQSRILEILRREWPEVYSWAPLCIMAIITHRARLHPIRRCDWKRLCSITGQRLDGDLFSRPRRIRNSSGGRESVDRSIRSRFDNSHFRAQRRDRSIVDSIRRSYKEAATVILHDGLAAQ